MGNNLLAATTGSMRDWGGKISQRGGEYLAPHFSQRWSQWSGLFTAYQAAVAILFLVILVLVAVLLWKNIKSFEMREKPSRESKRR